MSNANFMTRIESNAEANASESKYATELRDIKVRIAEANVLCSLLHELNRLSYGDTKLKEQYRSKLEDWKTPWHYFSDPNLGKAYDKLSDVLRVQFPDAVTPTTFEKEFLKHFKTYAPRTRIKTSAWIGPHCVDSLLFFRTDKTYAVAVEIDGPVHNEERKQNKDQFKEEHLARELKIAIARIPNIRVTSGYIKRFVDGLKIQRTLTGRTLRSLERNIHISTIAAWGNRVQMPFGKSFLSETFGLSRAQFRELEQIMRRDKRSSRHHSSSWKQLQSALRQ